jgi:hypothetical protein
MAKLINEITVITGTYINAQGQQKNRYQRIGSIIDTKNGPMLKIDVIPLKEGGWDGWAYINEPREREDQPGQQRQQSRQAPQGSGFDDMNDDLPNF